MKKYRFQSKLSEEEIAARVKALPNINLTSMTQMNNYYGDIKRKKICIGRTPDTLFSNFSFFCGKLMPSTSGVYIVGYFQPPLKLVMIPYCVICSMLLLEGGVRGGVTGIIACGLLHLIQRGFLSINTQSKKDIVSYITDNLNSAIL